MRRCRPARISVSRGLSRKMVKSLPLLFFSFPTLEAKVSRVKKRSSLDPSKGVESDSRQQKAAQIIFGGLSAKGVLPVSCGVKFKAGDGLQTTALNRLTYGLAESVGMDSSHLQKIDSIANHAISEQMTPGIQLLVARKGTVIYEKSFGYHTYKNASEVKFNNLYDVASLTKILATLPLLMELIDSGVITLDATLGDLLLSYKNTNKETITIQEMLSHYAQLKPWIPFYVSTLDSITEKPNPKFYKSKPSKKFPIKVNERLYLRTDFKDSIQNQIINSELLEEKEYRYSDLPYYILKLIIEKHYPYTDCVYL